MSIGKEIKKMREKRELTQDLMAQSLEISLSSYSRIEKDQASLESRNLQSILDKDFLTEKEQATLNKEFEKMLNAGIEEVSFGNLLLKFRLLKGLTGKEYAQKLETKKSTYQGLESGRLSPNSESARKLVKSKALSEEERKKLQKYIPKKSRVAKNNRKSKTDEEIIKREITDKQRMEYRRRKNIMYLRKEVVKPNSTRKRIKRAVPKSFAQKLF